jgi:hypothetical protein
LNGKEDEAHAAFRAVSGLLNEHRGMLPDSLADSLTEFQRQLTDQISPCRIEELDARKKKLDEQFPGYEHWHIRCGVTVTWCDRRKA